MDEDTFKLDKRKSPIIRPKPRPDSMLQAEPAPDVEFDNRDDLIQKLPRPKPRPVMIGSNPKTGATRGIDWTDLTREQLDQWGCKYHQLHMGKPNFDVYVCDKSFNSEHWFTQS